MPMETIAGSVAESWWAVGCAAAVTAAAGAVGRAALARGTTALPAALWGVGALVWLALDCGARAGGAVTQPPGAAVLRLVSVALAVSPEMALLGAKRPQHGVWQAIVAALGVVLVMPAAALALARPGSVPDVHALARGFVTVLLLVGWMNACGTARLPAATFSTLGWLLLARGFLPLVEIEAAFPPTAAAGAPAAAIRDGVGASLVAVGAWATVISERRRDRRRLRRDLSPATAPSFAAGVEPAWSGLRDTLGAAWALRVAERFDQVAILRGWPCRLRLGGITPPDAPDTGVWQRDARRTLRALLLRFVSPAWLDRHAWPGDEGPIRPRKPGTVH